MNLTKKKKQGLVLGVLIVFIGVVYWSSHFDSTFDSRSFIRIAGQKPADAKVKVWADYWVGGTDCESYSYDMFGRKAHQGGKMTRELTDDFAKTDDVYELRVPYANYIDSKHCTVKLASIIVEAHNAFDTAGFAQLRIYQAGNDYDNKAINLNSKIEAKECDSSIFKSIRKVWAGAIGCYLFINEKKISSEPNYNAETVYFYFSQFNDETVINYDILAGKDYRSEPLDPKTGE
ncbi:hypothetical protein [Vibrio algivorus]|uniref:Uncharacterized protein n=1 Tax=Vibrio algivorus TaxID=1667024 RepID=A0A557PFM8_9VIBR|nr:hypothetical protein [Vibrio algivorus]TVO39453.1 hypothetical protein FOF44_02375 [Vibrio algivorus]